MKFHSLLKTSKGLDKEEEELSQITICLLDSLWYSDKKLNKYLHLIYINPCDNLPISSCSDGGRKKLKKQMRIIGCEDLK